MDDTTSTTDYEMSSCASDISLADSAAMSVDSGYASSSEDLYDNDSVGSLRRDQDMDLEERLSLTFLATSEGTFKMGVEGSTPLRRAEHLTIQSSLDNALPVDFVSHAIQSASPQHVQSLTLSQIALDGSENDFRKLTAAIQSLKRLESLHLIDCYFPHNARPPLDGLLYGLATKGVLPSLRHVELNAVDIDAESAASFLDDAVLAYLVLYKPSLTRLSLEDMNLSKAHITHLAKALSFNKNLQHLKLWGCAVEDPGAVALASMLVTNTTLRWLDISYNDLTDVGYNALANALHVNKTLKGLELVKCGDISHKGYKAILEVFQWNHNIEQLHLQPSPSEDSNLAFHLFVNQHRYLVENENISKRHLVDLLASRQQDPTFLFLFLKAMPSLCENT